MSLFPRTLANRVRLTLFLIGFLPYLAILVYIHNLGEKEIIATTLATYRAELQKTRTAIASQLLSLEKEAHFLASLELMNDMIVEDIDKRIAGVLTQKYKDLGLHIALYTVTDEGKIIASSGLLDHSPYDHISALKKAQTANHYTFATDHSVILYAPIGSSLQKGKSLGYLLFEYPLENLSGFTLTQAGIASYIIHTSSGKVWSKSGDLPGANEARYLTLDEPLKSPLGDYRLVYRVDRDEALGFLDDFVRFIWLLFGVGFVVIALVSYRMGRRIIEQADTVSHAKSSFISHMSHELRTPLHTILGSTQYLLAYEQLSDEQIDKVATIETSADHLLGMINDVLDLVQIESGKMKTDIVTISSEKVAEISQEIISMIELLAEQKELSLEYADLLRTPLSVSLDIRLFKQIIINLLSNAIKFTDEGQITFTLIECDHDLCIEIRDSGIGIATEQLETLFTEFTQVNNRIKTGQKGNGLGLAISRKMAHLFGAEVTLSSEGVGKGTKAVLRMRRVRSESVL